MRVERITDIQEVLKCLPYESEIRSKGREYLRESVQLEFISSTIDNPMFGYFVAYNDNDEVLGYTFAILNLMIRGHERIILSRMYAKEPEIRDALIEALEEWAESYKIEVVQLVTNKHIKVFRRKYGFKPVSVVLERRISNG